MFEVDQVVMQNSGHTTTAYGGSLDIEPERVVYLNRDVYGCNGGTLVNRNRLAE